MRGGEGMRVFIEGNTEEIAALVLVIQERAISVDAATAVTAEHLGKATSENPFRE